MRWVKARLRALVDVSEAVRGVAGRLDKCAAMATYFASLAPSDLRLAASYLAGEVPQGALHLGWRAVDRVRRQPLPPLPLFEHVTPPPQDPLTLEDVDAAFTAIAQLAGTRAARRREGLLRALFDRAVVGEQDFLSALVLGEVRQGALRALVLEGLAAAMEVDVAALRRAVMFGAFGDVVRALGEEGSAALERFVLTPLRPVAPMLAATVGTLRDALADLSPAVAEWKLDGVRIQVHRDGAQVRVFTRQLRDVTPLLPEVVGWAEGLTTDRYVLDGEVIAWGDGGELLTFQDLWSEVSREGTARDARLEVHFFDLLLHGPHPLVDHPYRERRALLETVVGPERCVRQQPVTTTDEVAAFLESALAAGHEGLVLKNFDSPYTAGRRGRQWQKVKPAVTVDLVILAAEWGSGRRRGFLSNIHLGARDPNDPGAYRMLGKTFKGLTDAMLQAMTEDLLALETQRDGHVVHVRPERVVEIAFDQLQRSRRYDSGWALRFARVKRFRPDKSATEADTLEEVQSRAAAGTKPVAAASKRSI